MSEKKDSGAERVDRRAFLKQSTAGAAASVAGAVVLAEVIGGAGTIEVIDPESGDVVKSAPARGRVTTLHEGEVLVLERSADVGHVVLAGGRIDLRASGHFRFESIQKGEG